ncbi:hypothetical protein O181_034529 [Austropuccinia psidii MF-1]|uniref:Uncharacterized protein n=1 Tax=Austropuccinia psidii MF-1 TaxID=1389203 RepID=A0A9Q3H9M4_9BASI|nr:hypothetical protein [Austropuccinia psidii MF-1]
MDPLTILEDQFEASYVAFGSILELDATLNHSLSDQSANYHFNSINLMPKGNDSSEDEYDNDKYNVSQDHFHFHGYESTPLAAKGARKRRRL